MATYYNRIRLICEACRTDILDPFFTRCSNERCRAPFYHNRCLGATATEIAINWLCNKCKHEYLRGEFPMGIQEPVMPHVTPHNSRKGIAIDTQIGGQPGVNQNTYVGPPEDQYLSQKAPPPLDLGSKNGNQPTGQRPKVRTKRTINRDIDESDANPVSDDPYIVALSEVRRQIAALNELCANLSSATSTNSSRIDDVYGQLNDHDERLRSLEFWETEVLAMGGHVSVLDDNLSKTVEMIGIPEMHEEDLIEIALTAAESLEVELDDDDIDYITRVGDKNLSEAAKKRGRPVILKFVRKIKRDEFLKAGKSRGNLTTEDLNILCEPKRIYINERLPRDVRFLFNEARLRAKLANFKYCWTQNGRIYARKREGYPAVCLVNHLDLVEKLNARYYPLRRNRSGNS